MRTYPLPTWLGRRTTFATVGVAAAAVDAASAKAPTSTIRNGLRMRRMVPAVCLNRGMAERAQIRVGDSTYGIVRLDETAARLPYTLRILLENVLRNGGDAEAVSGWVATAEPSQEIAFFPGRVLLQDFTGVPCVVDLAAMRDAMRAQGGDPEKINPLIPVELVIDHSVQVDEFATRLAIERNVELEFERNKERYAFL